MMTQIWLAVGGAAGTLIRYWLNLLMTAWFGEALPWGTILINISGSLLIGMLASLTEPGGRWMVPPDIRLFLMVGLCGGYTTFSSFSLQTLTLLQIGEPLRAAVNIFGSVALGLFAVWIGYTAFSFLLHGSRS